MDKEAQIAVNWDWNDTPLKTFQIINQIAAGRAVAVRYKNKTQRTKGTIILEWIAHHKDFFAEVYYRTEKF